MMKGIAVQFIIFLSCLDLMGQSKSLKPQWIRPENGNSPAMWGIRGGIVFSLWPTAVGDIQYRTVGGPRGLLRIGYNFEGVNYLINYIAIEPVVNGEMEFSEISPSRSDQRLGKLIWAGSDKEQGKFFPAAITRGILSHPDGSSPEVEQLTIYLFVEKFLNGAHPYFKVTIRSDRPHEIGFQIFDAEDSAPMQRCALTATMGNYSRLRLLYLKDKIVDSRELYRGYKGIGFVEKDGYPWNELMKDKKGDFMAVATTNESFQQLADWPQDSMYLVRHHWRYRPFYKVTQYWRKEHTRFDSSLHVRVNGRFRYWSGGDKDPAHYIAIPGGAAFENFEMREKYEPGEQFYFGITRKTPEEMQLTLPAN